MKDHANSATPCIRPAMLLFGLVLAPGLAQAASPVWLQCVGSTFQVTADKPAGERVTAPDGKNPTPSLSFIVDRAKGSLALYSPETRSSRPIPGALFGTDRIEFSYTDGSDPRSGWIDRDSLNFHIDDRNMGAMSWTYDEGNCVIVKRGSLAGNATKQ